MKSVIQDYEPDVQMPTYPSNILEVSNQDQSTLVLLAARLTSYSPDFSRLCYLMPKFFKNPDLASASTNELS